MSERRYTAAEISTMRRCVEVILGSMPPFNYPGNWQSFPYNGNDRARHIEEMLRTYIIAGVDPADLVARCTWGPGGGDTPQVILGVKETDAPATQTEPTIGKYKEL
jgi:hypothetical protein